MNTRAKVTPKPRQLKILPEKVHPPTHLQQLRVAAYCRVSSKNECQLESLTNQNKPLHGLYTHKNPNWKMVGIFADQTSGKTLRGREQFLKLLEACKSRQIDLVLTKSIKRF